MAQEEWLKDVAALELLGQYETFQSFLSYKHAFVNINKIALPAYLNREQFSGNALSVTWSWQSPEVTELHRLYNL